MNDVDVTKLVEFGSIDDEVLPITQCACGQEYTSWEFIISIYRDGAYSCPNCDRRLYFSNRIRIFEVVDTEK